MFEIVTLETILMDIPSTPTSKLLTSLLVLFKENEMPVGRGTDIRLQSLTRAEAVVVMAMLTEELGRRIDRKNS